MMLTKIFFHKEKILTGLIVLTCLSLYGLFPTRDIFQDFVSSCTFLFIVPILYIKFILKKDPKFFGLRLGDWRQGLLWGLVMLLFSLSIAYTLVQYTEFANKYFIPDYSHKFLFFVLYEVFIVGFFVFLYDFFFRGFVQFSLVSKIGYGSIIVQTLLFALFLVSTDNLNWSFLPHVILAPLAGIVVYRSRSIIYSSLAGLSFFTLIEAYLIYITR